MHLPLMIDARGWPASVRRESVYALPMLLVAIAILSPQVLASEPGTLNWNLCPTQPTEFVKLSSSELRQMPIDFSADQARVDRAGTSVFSGNVLIKRSIQNLKADQARYNDRERVADVMGSVEYSDPNWFVDALSGEYDIDDDRMELEEAKYKFPSRHAQGGSEHVLRRGDGVVELDEAKYSTCEEGNEFWTLSGSHFQLNGETGVGTAKNVLLKLEGVPILYVPYMTFPLNNDRKSGFLAPSFGTSSESGFSFATPYYFNIAPDKDLTVTPRAITRRGLQLAGDSRYLGIDSKGEVGFEYLYDQDFGATRYAYLFKHKQNWFDGRLKFDADVNGVSDHDYLHDLTDALSISSTTHLQRRGDLTYSGRQWEFLGRMENFQTLDDSILPQNRPAERLPQLMANGHYDKQALGLGYTVHSEWTDFVTETGPEGSRYDFALGLNRPFEGAGYFVRPKVEVDHTGYDLHGTAAGTDKTPSRTLPVSSLDSGLVFERLGEKWTQTIEPRLYYLYIPFEKQDDLPVFDTGEYDFNLDQLFRENRFNGVDRIENANQLTSTLTGRLIDSLSGRERASLTVGQIAYFDDRKVQLPGETVVNTTRSDWVGELNYQLTQSLGFSSLILWDTDRNTLDREIYQIKYRGDDNRIINLSFRRRTDVDLRQTDLAFAWPITPAFRVVGRFNFDLTAAQDLETFAGFEYESCCFAIRVVGRRYVNQDRDQHNNAILVELVLKGLTSLGSPVNKHLEHGILGYDNDDDY